MPSTLCQCAMIPQTAEAGPGLHVCHHYSNTELIPIVETLDAVINQFNVGINPEFMLDTPLRDQLEAYFRDVWEFARQQTIDDDEPDPGEYDPQFLDSTIRLTLTISFMRHMGAISQLLMTAIVQHLNDSRPEAEDDPTPPVESDVPADESADNTGQAADDTGQAADEADPPAADHFEPTPAAELTPDDSEAENQPDASASAEVMPNMPQTPAEASESDSETDSPAPNREENA